MRMGGLGDGCTFARLRALTPRVLKFRVSRISALLKPRATASTTRDFARLTAPPTLRTRAACVWYRSGRLALVDISSYVLVHGDVIAPVSGALLLRRPPHAARVGVQTLVTAILLLARLDRILQLVPERARLLRLVTKSLVKSLASIAFAHLPHPPHPDALAAGLSCEC